MISLRNLALLMFLTLIFMSSCATAQIDLGQALFDQFITSIFPSQYDNPAVFGSPTTGFPDVTLEPSPVTSAEDFSSDYLEESPEESWAVTPSNPWKTPTPGDGDILDGLSPDQSLEPQAILPRDEAIQPESEDVSLVPQAIMPNDNIIPTNSSVPTVGQDSLETNTENKKTVPTNSDSQSESLGIDAIMESVTGNSMTIPQSTSNQTTENILLPVDARSIVFEAIRINCGSLTERGVFSDDSAEWYNPESKVAYDPYASAQFTSASEALLYSTSRYAEDVIRYKIPVPTNGVFHIILQWAELSRDIKEGDRVFRVCIDYNIAAEHRISHKRTSNTDFVSHFVDRKQVIINDKEQESNVDVVRDSIDGHFSPLLRSYTADVTDYSIKIELRRIVGPPMISAIQIMMVSPYGTR